MRPLGAFLLFSLCNTLSFLLPFTCGTAFSQTSGAGAQTVANPSGQNSKAAASPQPAVAYRPGAGTQILGELPKPLNAKKLKVGDAVECRLIQDLLFQGKIVIPKKARVWGHITEIVLSTKEQPQSRVGIVFDKVVLPDKKELPFEHPAIVVALGAPIRTNTVHTTKPTDMPVLMTKGQDTGASMIGAIGANSQLAGANMPSSTGAISAANRGVIGIKGVALDNTNPGYTAFVSQKGNLNLDFDVQVLLQVTGNTTPKAQ